MCHTAPPYKVSRNIIPNRQSSLVTKYIDHLKGSVILPPDAHRALGMTFHIADLYLPEIKALVAAEAEAGIPAERAAVPGTVLRALLGPFVSLMEETTDLVTLTRIRCDMGEGENKTFGWDII